MNKRNSNNLDTIIMALSTLVFESAKKFVIDIEQSEKLKDIAKELNSQPFLKRMLDFTILYFWVTTISCELYYSHDEFMKICSGVEKNIYEGFSKIEEEQKIFGLVLKDYVTDKDELVLFYRQFPVGDETKIGFNVLLEVILNKRLFDYNSVLHLDLSQQSKKVSSLFLKHAFGKKEYEYEKLENIMLHACLAVNISAFGLLCSKAIDDTENLLANNPGLNFNIDTLFRIIKKKEGPIEEDDIENPFIKTLKDIVISEEDCGILNGITVQAVMRNNKIIKNFQDRVLHRFALEQVNDTKTNQKIVRQGEEITEETLELIINSGIKKIKIRSALTCQSEKGICLKCYGRKNIVGNSVKLGQDVGLEAAYFWNEIAINEEIKELLNPKPPEGSAILSEIDGIVEVKEGKDNLKTIFVKSNTGLIREYHVSPGKTVRVKDKEFVIAEQQLTSGKISSHDILRISGDKRLLEYLTQQILPYLSIANFDERMIELLFRQMMVIEIDDSGDTSFTNGQIIVNKIDFYKENISAIKKGKRPAIGTPVFIGIKT
ncbi:MAG: hypothetical protein WAQ07_05695 [Candidatus Omnitrophota bacterium]